MQKEMRQKKPGVPSSTALALAAAACIEALFFWGYGPLFSEALILLMT